MNTYYSLALFFIVAKSNVNDDDKNTINFHYGGKNWKTRYENLIRFYNIEKKGPEFNAV